MQSNMQLPNASPTLIASLDDVPILKRSYVKIKQVNNIIDKLNCIIAGGKDRLQVITDYDLTITKQHSNGRRTLSSFGLLVHCKNLPEKLMERDKQLMEKYYPIERDPDMSLAEKIPHMVKWYGESQEMFTGVHFSANDLDIAIKEFGPELRDGFIDLCKTLKTNQIPVLVLSAGLGNVLQQVLHHNGLQEHEHFHIVSNFFKLEGDVIQGFGCDENGQFLHSCNKSGLGCSEYFKKLGPERQNIILMGDSIGDASMDQGVPHLRTSLKIGYLYGTEELVQSSLATFMDKFDIVLVDDQTTAVPQEILALVL